MDALDRTRRGNGGHGWPTPHMDVSRFATKPKRRASRRPAPNDGALIPPSPKDAGGQISFARTEKSEPARQVQCHAKEIQHPASAGYRWRAGCVRRPGAGTHTPADPRYATRSATVARYASMTCAPLTGGPPSAIRARTPSVSALTQRCVGGLAGVECRVADLRVEAVQIEEEAVLAVGQECERRQRAFAGVERAAAQASRARGRGSRRSARTRRTRRRRSRCRDRPRRARGVGRARARDRRASWTGACRASRRASRRARRRSARARRRCTAARPGARRTCCRRS